MDFWKLTKLVKNKSSLLLYYDFFVNFLFHIANEIPLAILDFRCNQIFNEPGRAKD